MEQLVIMRWRITVLGSFLMTATFSAPVYAVDAEWGCQVLLCAASVDPSWHGVPYCVPPMVKLIEEMAKPHFSWPTCSSAGTKAPGYDKYGDCPAGYSLSYTLMDSGNHSSSEPNLCVKTTNHCGARDYSGHGSDGCGETLSRPLRDQPYYFDIRQSSGNTQRSWFDLKH